MKPENNTAAKVLALGFGLFLGLCIWKFGDPVILDAKIGAPTTGTEFLNEAWPTHWARYVLFPLAAAGLLLIFQNRAAIRSCWLWLLPLLWLGWQFVSATATVDADLTADALWQFAGCVTCYFLGALLFARRQLLRWVLPGVLAAFTFCLVRAVNQRVFEFPSNYQVLVEGEQCGWTNFPPQPSWR